MTIMTILESIKKYNNALKKINNISLKEINEDEKEKLYTEVACTVSHTDYAINTYIRNHSLYFKNTTCIEEKTNLLFEMVEDGNLTKEEIRNIILEADKYIETKCS